MFISALIQGYTTCIYYISNRWYCCSELPHSYCVVFHGTIFPLILSCSIAFVRLLVQPGGICTYRNSFCRNRLVLRKKMFTDLDLTLIYLNEGGVGNGNSTHDWADSWGGSSDSPSDWASQPLGREQWLTVWLRWLQRREQWLTIWLSQPLRREQWLTVWLFDCLTEPTARERAMTHHLTEPTTEKGAVAHCLTEPTARERAMTHHLTEPTAEKGAMTHRIMTYHLTEPTVGQLGKVPDEGEELLATQVEANKVPALLQLLHSLET